MGDKNIILERLEKRDAERIERLQKQHKAKAELTACNEQADIFIADFKERTDKIESALALAETIDSSQIPYHFESLKKELNDLHKYVVASSLFLNDFNSRSCLSIVQSLQTRCFDLEEKLAPRKKFGFSRKKTKKVENLNTANTKPKDVVDGINYELCHKWDNDLFGFDTRENEKLFLNNSQVFQKDVTLRNLKNCVVILEGALGTLHINNVVGCVILCGPVTTSVFIDKCQDSKLALACQQLRMHSSNKCDIYLHVTSTGIIEDSSNIRVAPYNFLYEDIDKHFAVSSLDTKTNNWDKLNDFNWLAADIQSPNWSVLDQKQRVTNWSQWCSDIHVEELNR